MLNVREDTRRWPNRRNYSKQCVNDRLGNAAVCFFLYYTCVLVIHLCRSHIIAKHEQNCVVIFTVYIVPKDHANIVITGYRPLLRAVYLCSCLIASKIYFHTKGNFSPLSWNINSLQIFYISNLDSLSIANENTYPIPENLTTWEKNWNWWLNMPSRPFPYLEKNTHHPAMEGEYCFP